MLKKKLSTLMLVAGLGAMGLAQAATCPVPQDVVYNDVYHTWMSKDYTSVMSPKAEQGAHAVAFVKADWLLPEGVARDNSKTKGTMICIYHDAEQHEISMMQNAFGTVAYPSAAVWKKQDVWHQRIVKRSCDAGVEVCRF